MKKPKIYDHLNDLIRSKLSYDPDTGLMTWRPKPGTERETRRWNTRYAGKVACAHNDDGYSKITLRTSDSDYVFLGHRVCWLLHYGEWPAQEIDHVNHIRDDNRIDNLRLSDREEQNRNRSLPCNNKSGFIGVTWLKSKKKWRAIAGYKRKYYFLGYYVNPEDAAVAVQAFRKEKQFHGNHGAAQ